MKILITGSTGMVGQNILESKIKDSHQLVAPTRKELDLFNKEAVEKYIASQKPDLVIHCAGRVGGIQANIKNPVEYLVENVDLNRNVIMGARNAGVKRLLNLGSSCMYPKDTMGSLDEQMILTGALEPTNEGYALAKIMAHKLCDYIRRENKEFMYKTLIPCNLYGRFDKFGEEHSHLIPAVIKKIHLAKVNNAKDVEIWGDGTARREFMYTADLVDCIAKAIVDLDFMPDVMNVGLGHDYSVNEYYLQCAEVIGYAGKFTHDLSKPVGMKRKLTSIERLKEWGWSSKTSLRSGLEQTYDYYLSTLK